MKRLLLLAGALMLVTSPAPAWKSKVPTEQVPASTKGAPTLPEDLFALPPAEWHFARQLWSGDEPCTKDACEAGYTSGDLVVSVERSKKDLRVLAGFRGCANVAWNEFRVGGSASERDSKKLTKRLQNVVGTAATYCKVTAPVLPVLDAARLFPAKPAATA
jgi:hypothetical protein